LFLPTLWLTFSANQGEEDSMAKKLIAIPKGNLMSIARAKGVTTVSALKEKTGVDRKTLRAIDTGRPVKDTTLQSIADRLRVPLAHLLGPNAADKPEDVSGGDEYQYREIKLQRLDAAALRQLARETDEITWLLKIDQMSEELEALLLKLEKSLHGWFVKFLTLEDPGMDTLLDQISHIKTTTNIDKCIEELVQHKLKIYGGTYVFWNKEQPRHHIEDYPLPILRYTSCPVAALCIAPEETNISTFRVATGWEPPQNFVESKLAGIDRVEIDYKRVWSRDEIDVSDEKYGLVEIPF
jgi:transcriptional regulator with XRE-family HTH domain